MSENEIKPVVFDGSELRHGCVQRPKRWSGDTHDDLGGSVDEAATDALMAAAADAIDRLTAERDASVAEVAKMEELVAAAKRARRCLAWACEQRPEFNAEYEAFNEAIDATRAEGGV
ncbi:hypothetical protein [Stenotrophomonas sp. UBA7606]|uniref:hypothetical protein n=1 Tax=Stenotrophomonas sp. UBA7606 TaxID=1947559 RepID=UPI0025FC0DF0|nr:hypothetical protein [Stenotrophomonas sp. UBA7606]